MALILNQAQVTGLAQQLSGFFATEHLRAVALLQAAEAVCEELAQQNPHYNGQANAIAAVRTQLEQQGGPRDNADEGDGKG